MFTVVYLYKCRGSPVDQRVVEYFIDSCQSLPFVSYYIVTTSTLSVPNHIKCVVNQPATVGCLLDNSTFGPTASKWLNKLDPKYIKQFFVPLQNSYADLFPRTFIGTVPQFSLPYNGIYIVAPHKPPSLPYSSTFVDMSRLDQYSHLFKPKFTFFMPYYDEPIYTTYGPYYHFIKPLHLDPPTVYFESEAFCYIRSVPDTDYVGILTFAFSRKTNHNLEQLITRLNVLCDGNQKDIIALYCPNRGELLSFATRTHGTAFLTLWKYILTQLNMVSSEIPNAFYSNLWVMKRKYFLEYLELAQTVIQSLNSAPPEIKLLLYSNANYRGKISKPNLIERINLPYYPYHPFLLERLVCLFAHHKQLNLAYI